MKMKFKSKEQEAHWIGYCACNAQVLVYSALNKEIVNFEMLKKISKPEMEFVEKIGMGNPATLRMVLYSLLVMPKEIFNVCIPSEVSALNQTFAQKAQPGTISNYSNESDIASIKYIRHLRNAVAHGSVNGIGEDCVTFRDVDTRNGFTCTMVFTWSDIGVLCGELLNPQGLF